MLEIMNAHPWVALVPIWILVVMAIVFIGWVSVRPVSSRTIVFGILIIVVFAVVTIPNSIQQFHHNQKMIDAARRVHREHEAKNATVKSDAPEQNDAREPD